MQALKNYRNYRKRQKSLRIKTLFLYFVMYLLYLDSSEIVLICLCGKGTGIQLWLKIIFIISDMLQMLMHQPHIEQESRFI